MKVIFNMKNILIFGLSFLIFLQAQLLEELDNFYNFQDRFNYEPKNIYENDGLWYDEVTDELFTGRLKIYSKNNFKISEFTIIKGVKNGLLVQYYNKLERLPGIRGLYINGEKEGLWEWISPDPSYSNNAWRDSESQIITNIEYRDGKRDGFISVDRAKLEINGLIDNYSYPRNDILLRGRYKEGIKTGEWLYNEYTISDFDEVTEPMNNENKLFYWSRKEIYNSGNLISSECQEPWNIEIQCFEKSPNLLGPEFVLFPRSKIKNTETIEDRSTLKVKNDNGQYVDVNIHNLLYHVKKEHNKGISKHKQKGSVFTIDNDFRKMLNNKKNK